MEDNREQQQYLKEIVSLYLYKDNKLLTTSP
jgi:hypothetical protein